MTAAELCLVILLTPGINGAQIRNGCALSQSFIDSGARHKLDPLVLAAIAWKETGFNPRLIGSSGECGPMQVLPQHSQYTCRELGGTFGVEGGAQALKRWLRGMSTYSAIYRYNCGHPNKKRCAAYRADVIRKIGALRRSPLRLIITG